jgi:hypothetical protein
VLDNWEEPLVDSDEVLMLEEREDEEELSELVEIVTDDETLELDVDRIVLELPSKVDDEGTSSLAPQTLESLLPVPSALCIYSKWT